MSNASRLPSSVRPAIHGLWPLLLLLGCQGPTDRLPIGVTSFALVPAPQASALLVSPSGASPSTEPGPAPSSLLLPSAPPLLAPVSQAPGATNLILRVGATELSAGPNGLQAALNGQPTGDVTLISPGFVTSTIDILPGMSIPALHPLGIYQSPAPTGQATLSGVVTPPQAGLIVSYRSQGRLPVLGASIASDGSFSFAVPLEHQEAGVVVVQDQTEAPALALARVTLNVGQAQTVYGLSTQASGPTQDPPAAPIGMNPTGAVVELAENDANGPYRLPILTLTSPSAPSYAASGFQFVNLFSAVAPDGFTGAETSGPAGQVPDFLSPPDLSAIAAVLAPNGTISWSPVQGATLYTVQLTDTGGGSPLWEGATIHTSLPLPPDLPLGRLSLTLKVIAWDASSVNLYSVASFGSLRRLRVPQTPTGLTGRSSWSIRTNLSS